MKYISLALLLVSVKCFGAAGGLSGSPLSGGGSGSTFNARTLQDANSNTWYGPYALGSNSSGYYNIAIGELSQASVTNSHDQISIGVQALYNQLSDRYNLAIGNRCIWGPTLAEDNVCIGRDIMIQYLGGNEAQYDNVLVGNTAGESLRGVGCVGLGFGTLSGINNSGNTGSYNIAIGHYTGNSMNGGAHNILIGEQVDTPDIDVTANDQLAIGSTFHSAGGYFFIGNIANLTVKPSLIIQSNLQFNTNLVAVGFKPDFKSYVQQAVTNTGPVIIGAPINVPTTNWERIVFYVKNTGASLQSIITTPPANTNANGTMLKVTNLTEITIDIMPTQFTNIFSRPIF